VAPEAFLLSNGHYRALVSAAGAGGSFLGDTALTRWTADGTRDVEGLAFYIRDRDSGHSWSAGLQPLAADPENASAHAAPGRVDLVRQDGEIQTRLSCAVAVDQDLEVRRLTLRNLGRRPRRLQLTSYVEVALNHPAADAAHPAFSKLFVQTEYVGSGQLLLARRRPRSPEEPIQFMGHSLTAESGGGGASPRFETDRARFLGRGRDVTDPAGLDAGCRLSRTKGSVLDPVLVLRREVRLPPGGSAGLVALLAAGPARQGLLDRLTPEMAATAPLQFAAAAERDRALLEHHGLTPATRRSLPRLTGALLYGAPHAVLGAPLPRPDQPTRAGLARLGLSGTLPLVVCHARRPADIELADQLTRTAEYWRAQGLALDLWIVLDEESHLRPPPPATSGRGVTLVARGDAVQAPLVALARRAARLLVDPALLPPEDAPRERAVYHPVGADAPSAPLPRGERLLAFNGYGGFTPEGGEYVIRLPRRRGRLLRPPLTWVNLLANEETGCLTSDRGPGYTWNGNSRENRLTPWSNDPVADPAGEALYLRDEAAGVFWSPTPGPVAGAGDYEVRHGFGYALTRHRGAGLEQEVLTFVPRHDSLRLVRLALTNRARHPRELSAFAYAQWVLGGVPQDTRGAVSTAFDPASGALLAMNPDNGEFASRVAFAGFLALGREDQPEWTADRMRFLGRHGSVAAPQAVTGTAPLDGRAGTGMDPCAAFRLRLRLAPDERVELVFALGQAEDLESARALLARYREGPAVEAALALVRGYWADLTGRVQVETPSPAIDLMLNGWLTYQNLACRMWGRSAFYQSGGALGFRDQLQDAVALIHLDPTITRRQILLHAAHQFPQGDVLHWWHPPTAKGIRTRFSDDLLWLPWATLEYLRHTGEEALLEEVTSFVESPELAPGEDEIFVFPRRTGGASLYDHCCRALDRSLTRGVHGIPLMGTGDWNDGMNRVGREGRGESVWLGFFLYQILTGFVPLCRLRGDRERADRYGAYLAALGRALDREGWDGAWYRRAWYDNGAPLGSAASDECRIDAIAQAWAVLSRAAPAAKATAALDALERYLVDETAGILRLLTPAFDRTPNDPGYIKGYLPGVRENGGQYTHGALWAVRALAEAGRRERAAPLLEMLSPVRHGGTPSRAARYQVEPYVVPADVYGVAPHLGRGGWTWYTGSAGWMFRVGLESILGLTVLENTRLRLAPCLPAAWPGFRLTYRLPGEGPAYAIVVRREAASLTRATLDGRALEVTEGGAVIVPIGGRGTRRVEVALGRDSGPRYESSAAPLERITSA
jgi:cellobiose phosphorylase